MTNYLYNGVELPELPERDKGAYPYAIIRLISNIRGNRAYLYYLKTATAVVYETEDDYYADGVIFSDRLEAVSIMDKESGTYPDFGELKSVNDGTFVPLINMLWANVDIYKPDGTLYLAASDPIPVPTLTARDLYRKINGKPTKLTLYKKLGGKLIPLDEHTKEVKT